MEVFLGSVGLYGYSARFLHIRGGVSGEHFEALIDTAVFSTYVEVFLLHRRNGVLMSSFLHIRGGVSIGAVGGKRSGGFSPHTWRCFH